VESPLHFRYFENGRYAILQESDLLLCISGDTDLVWWDLAQSKVLARIDVKSRGFNNEFAVSPTEPLLASIAAGDYVSLWDLKTTRPLGQILGPREFHSVSFSPDGRRLVSGSSGKGALRLWDVSTMQEIARFGTDFERTLTSVQFSPDGNIICSVDNNRAYFLRAPSRESVNALQAKNKTERR
jgi:WD40 repeat protein